MADTATAEIDRPNKVEVEDIGPARKKLRIEIPAETVEEQLGASIDTLAIEASLPGFRKGRVPRRLIERKFGDAVRDEAKKQLIAAAYSGAIEEHELKVIGEPISEGLDDVSLESGKPFAFDVEVEVQPNFEMPDLDGIDVKKPLLETTDDLITQEFDRIALNEGALESVEAPLAGDYLTGHAIMTGTDGTEHFNVEDAVIQVPSEDKEGKGMILGIMVEDFSAQLGTPAMGDEITIKTKGPEQHEVEAIRDDDLTVSFKVSHIDRIIPASGETLAQRIGVPGEAEVREFIGSRIERRLMIDQQSVMHRQIAKHLLDAVEMELPERVTTHQAARLLQQRRLELMHRGLSEDQIEENVAELRNASKDAAVRDLKLFFILNRAADSLEVAVNEAEVNGRIHQIAMSRNQRPEAVRKELIRNGLVNQIVVQVRDHKTLDAILARAKVTEMSVDDFNAAMGDGDGDGDGDDAAPAKKKTTKKKTKKKTTKKSDS